MERLVEEEKKEEKECRLLHVAQVMSTLRTFLDTHATREKTPPPPQHITDTPQEEETQVRVTTRSRTYDTPPVGRGDRGTTNTNEKAKPKKKGKKDEVEKSTETTDHSQVGEGGLEDTTHSPEDPAPVFTHSSEDTPPVLPQAPEDTSQVASTVGPHTLAEGPNTLTEGPNTPMEGPSHTHSPEDTLGVLPHLGEDHHTTLSKGKERVPQSEHTHMEHPMRRRVMSKDHVDDSREIFLDEAGNALLPHERSESSTAPPRELITPTAESKEEARSFMEEDWEEDYRADAPWSEILEKIEEETEPWPQGFSWIHRRMFYNGLMCIPITHTHRLIRLHHAVAGHPGGERHWREMQRFYVFGTNTQHMGFV